MRFTNLATLVGGLLAAVGLALAGAPAAAQAPGGGPPPAVAVAADAVIERPIPDNRMFVGTLMPLRRSTIGSAVEGRVEEFTGIEGTWVQAGQTLAELRKRTIEIEIAAASAELLLRQQEYEEMKAGSRPEEIAHAKAKQEEARALATYTKEKLRRTQRLYEGGGSSTKEELDLGQSQSDSATQAFLAAQAEYELAAKGNRLEKVEQARARWEAAKEQVNLLQDRFEKYSIKAPFDGYVVAEHTEVGEWVKSGDPVVELIAVDPMKITVNVPEAFIPGLQQVVAARDQQNLPTGAVVRVDAIGHQPFAGTVIDIVPQADLRSRTFPVKVQVSNPRDGRSHRLKSGMLAHVTLPVGQELTGTLVSKDALVLGESKPAVFVVVSDPQSKQTVARKVPVELGLADGEFFQVQSLLDSLPLKAGQQVITRGNERLRDGQPVKVVAAASAPASGPPAAQPPAAGPPAAASARVER